MDKAVSRYQAMTPEQKKIYLEKCKEYTRNKTATDPNYAAARKEASRKWREKNKQYRKEYYDKNKEKELLNNKLWYLSNKDKVKEIQNKYVCNNPEKIKATRKASYIKHKNSRVKKLKEWLDKNPEKRKQYKQNERRKNKTNKSLFLRHSISNSIRNALRNKNLKKSSCSEKLLGCSVAQYRQYLESLFEGWMSWNNWGKHKDDGIKRWNIDHIIPLSHFDLNDTEQQKKAFHYTNTRPLEAFKNLSEGNRRNYY